RGAADAEFERCTAVLSFRAGCERASKRLLPGCRRLETRTQAGVRSCGLGPTLDAAGRLEPRDGRDQMPTREVVGGRERLSVGVVGRLLGDGGEAESTPDGDSPERARRATDLARDDG